MHFNSHEKVKTAISPHSIFTNTRLDEDTYTAFNMLMNLSRRSRYLCHEFGKNPENNFLIDEKHFIKAFRQLDILMKFIDKHYDVGLPVNSINYDFQLKTPNLVYFRFVQA